MKWKTIKIDNIKKECRFTVQLDYHRLTVLKKLMIYLGTKQKAKAIKYLLDHWERIEIDLFNDIKEIIKE